MGVLVKEKLQLQQQQVGVMLKEQCRRGGGGGRGGGLTFVQLEPEPPLPCGWEKCLDLQSGLIYFKDWNTGTQVYSDPRQCNRIEPLVDEDHDDSLNLSLNPPGANCLQQQQSLCTVEKVRNTLKMWTTTRSVGVKRSASLSSEGMSLTNSLSTSLALHSLSRRRSSSSRESSSPGPLSEASSKRSTPLGSQCSSECLTSPSTMLHQGDEEEVQQPRSSSREPTAMRRADTLATEAVQELYEDEDDAVMVAVGCRSCMMYIMLPKLHPSCPKCGNTDSLLDFPTTPMPKKQRSVLQIR